MNSTTGVSSNDVEQTGTHGTQLTAGAFWVYKRCVSPLLHSVAPGGCRYLPTCSEYAYTALTKFGLLKGGWLAMRRLLRCHPWAEGGLDPVPESASVYRSRSSRAEL